MHLSANLVASAKRLCPCFSLQLFKEPTMTTLFKLEEHLMMLLVEDKICFEEGDWDHLAKIRMAIDDTRDQIESFKKVPA
jgi:hypothetical protein